MKPLVVLMVAASWPFFIWQVMNATKGVFGQITGAVNNGTRGLVDRNRKFRSNERQNAAKRLQQGNRLQGGQRRIVDENGNVVQRGNWRGRVNQRAQRISALGTSIRDQGIIGGLQSSSIDTAIERRTFDNVMDMANSDDRLKHIKDNDTLLEAAMHTGQAAEIRGQVGTDASVREYLEYNARRAIAQRRGVDVADIGLDDPDLNRGEIDQQVRAVGAARRALGDRNLQVFASVFNAGTGTGYANGPDEMLAAIERAAGDDRALAKRMAIAAKGMAGQNRRPDLAGFGVGAMVGQQDRIHAAAAGRGYMMTDANGVQRPETLDEALAGVRETLTDASLFVQGPGAVVSQRGGAMRNMLPAILRRVDNAVEGVGTANAQLQGAQQSLAAAQQTGDQAAITNAQAAVVQAQAALQQAQRHSEQVFAQTAAFQSLAQQIAPENAEILANGYERDGVRVGGILSHQVVDPASGRTATVMQTIELMRAAQPQAFVELERQYNSQYAAQAAQAAAGAQGQQGPGAPPNPAGQATP